MDAAAPQLRPRSVTDLVDATFNLYRQNFALFAGVVAVLMIPETLINMAIVGTVGAGTRSSIFVSTSQDTTTSTLGSTYAASGLEGLVSAVFSVLILGAISFAISRRFLHQSITVLGAYQGVEVGPFLTLAGTIVVAVAALILYVVFAIMVGVILGVVAAPLAVVYAILAGLVSVVLFIYVAMRMVFVAPAVVIERQGIIESIRRSWWLSRGYFWRIFGLVLLVGIIVAVVGGLTGALAAAVTLGNPVLGTGLSGIFNVLVQPIQYCAYILLYYDHRIRKEGFDLEYAAQQAQAATSPWFPPASS